MERVTLKSEGEADEVLNYDRRPIIEDNAVRRHSNPVLVAMAGVVESVLDLHIDSYFYYFFKALFPTIHLICCLYWTWIRGMWEGAGYSEMMKIIDKLLTFSTNTAPNVLDYVQLSVPLGLTIIHFVVSILLLRTYLRKWSVSNRVAMLSAVWFEILPLVLVMPNLIALASTFWSLGNKDPVAIVFLLIYICVNAYTLFVAYCSLILINYATKPSISVLSVVDGVHYFVLMVGCSTCMMIGKVTELTSKWSFVFALAARTAVCLYLIVDVFNFIHAKLSGAALCLGLYCAMIVSDLLACVECFRVAVPYHAKFMLPLMVGVVACISGYFILRHLKRKIAAKLDCRAKDHRATTEFYESLGIKNYKQAIKYLIVGFTEGVPRVLDGTFPMFVAKKFDHHVLWLRVCEFTLMLPCNATASATALDYLVSLIQQGTIQKLLLNHLNNVQSKRFQIMAQESDIMVVEMKSAAESCIELAKRFWYEVGIKNDSSAEKTIYTLASTVPVVKQRWKEILTLRPGQPELAFAYSRFCIECLGKFETGVIYDIRSKYIQQGYQASLDPLFRAFVLSQPKLWRQKIVDRTGQVTIKEDMTRSTQSSGSATDSATTVQEKLQEDVDVGALDVAARELMEWPRLRMHLTKATSHYRPPLLMSIRILKAIVLLAWVCGVAAATALYSYGFNTMQACFERTTVMNTCRTSLSYMRDFIFLIYANQTKILFSNDQYESIIPEDRWNTAESLYYYKQPELSLKHIATATMDAFVFLYNSFAKSGLDGENVTRIVDAFANNSILRTRFRATGEVVERQTSAKNAILSLFWTYQSYLNVSQENYAGFLTSTELLDTCMAHMTLSSYLSNTCDDFALQAERAFAEDQRKMIITVSVLLITGLFIVAPLTHLPQIIILREYRKMRKALFQVRTEDATKATNPIVIQVGAKGDISPLQSLSSNNRLVMLMLGVAGFLTIVVLVIVGSTLAVFTQYGKVAMKVIVVSRFGSTRDALISEIFGYIIMLLTLKERSTSCYTREDVYQHYQSSLTELNSVKEKFAHGTSDMTGIYTLDPKVQQFHITDKCASDISGGTSFYFYSCLSLERALSTFFVYSEDLSSASSSNTLKGELFINYLHFVTGILDVHLKESQQMVSDLVLNSIYEVKVGTVTLLAVVLVIVIVNWVIKSYVENKLMSLLKTVLMLLRRLPPPVIATTPVITDALIVTSKRAEGDTSDPVQLLFHYSQAPMLSLGASCVIELMNQAFSNVFHFADDHLVGQHLSLVIPRPLAGDNEQTPEQQGAFHLYDKIERMARDGVELPCTYPVKIRCGDGTEVSTEVTVHPVQAKVGEINQFVLIAEDKRELVLLDNKIREAKLETKYLSAKLVPVELESIFANHGYDYVHTVESATLITVHVKDMRYLITDTEHAVEKLHAELNTVCEMFPPFTKYQAVFDAFFFIGGLVPDETKNHADIGLKFAVELKKVIHRIVPRKTHQRYALSVVTGGPVSCVLLGDTEEGCSRRFDLISSLIDDGTYLVSLAPPNTIIIAGSTSERLTEIPVTLSGPNFKDMPTLLL